MTTIEDKQQICDKFAELLKITRFGASIDRIEYNPNTECALVFRKDRKPIPVNVAMDSGNAIIKDILRGLGA